MESIYSMSPTSSAKSKRRSIINRSLQQQLSSSILNSDTYRPTFWRRMKYKNNKGCKSCSQSSKNSQNIILKWRTSVRKWRGYLLAVRHQHWVLSQKNLKLEYQWPQMICSTTPYHHLICNKIAKTLWETIIELLRSQAMITESAFCKNNSQKVTQPCLNTLEYHEEQVRCQICTKTIQLNV